jgi:uracil-DNA glycosylase family 4
MAVKSLQDLSLSINPCQNRACQACGLYTNQYPVLDQHKTSNIFWVGLSAVQFAEGEKKLPLARTTRTGALIHQLEEPFSDCISFYKTNLVKCVPLKNHKIRYPQEHELEKCFPNFLYELTDLRPTVVFLLGKQVASFVYKKFEQGEAVLPENFQYQPQIIDNTIFVPVHHPSYVLVYKRKFMEEYISNIQALFFSQYLATCSVA